MSIGKLADLALERASVLIPRVGIATAEVVTTSSDVILAGQQTLTIGSLELAMTVTSGDKYRQRGHYTLVAGQGGWRTSIEAQSYNNALEVKLSTVLRDAASACGETLGAITERRIGPGYVRPAGPASRVLGLLSEGWHVDESGITRVGVRPQGPVLNTGNRWTITDESPAAQSKEVAFDPADLALVMPGAQLSDGWEIASVIHELTPTSLRSKLTRVDGTVTASIGAAFRRLYEVLSREVLYKGLHEYSITGVVSGGYLDLSPRSNSSRLPSLANVPMTSGVPGAWSDPRVGGAVLVGFGDGLPTRPYVIAYEGRSGEARIPTALTLDTVGSLTVGASATTVTIPGTMVPVVPGAVGHFVRYGDIIAGPVSFGAPLTIAQQTPGAPVSKAKS